MKNIHGIKQPQFLIYGLRDPRTNEIRYVGRSSSGLLRPNQHWKVKEKTHKGRWISLLRKAKFKYEIVVLEVVKKQSQLRIAEQKWIDFGRSAGTITNQMDACDVYVKPAHLRRSGLIEKRKIMMPSRTWRFLDAKAKKKNQSLSAVVNDLINWWFKRDLCP